MAQQLVIYRKMEIDARDTFDTSCKNWSMYPCNIIDTRHPRSSLRRWNDQLTKAGSRLFEQDSERVEMDLLDVYNERNPLSVTLTSDAGLTKHLEQNRKDPMFRHVSFEADSSMDRLNCSTQMFRTVCSFHQVPPTFLDQALSFGETTTPLDCGLATFCSDDTLLETRRQALCLKSLGRSGKEIRLSYLLRSVEPSKSIPNWPWGIRHLAVYHCFDVETGRSTWITLKGNSLLRDRIEELVSSDLAQGPNMLASASASLATSLDVHSLVLDWCDENWRWLINDVEKAVRRIVDKAKSVNIGADTQAVPEDIKLEISRRNTDVSKTLSPSSTFAEKTFARVSSIPRLIKRLSVGRSWPMDEKAPKGMLEADRASQHSEAKDHQQARLDSLAVLGMFSFNELQTLQRYSEKIEEVLLVIKLNSLAIARMGSYYRNLLESRDVDSFRDIQISCRKEMLAFLAKVDAVVASLGLRKEQLESLQTRVKDGRTLYDDILQYRSTQINMVYTQSSHESSRKLEHIAQKTEQETVSMHIITFVTLVFLPGTFIAGLFQSGVFQWPDRQLGDQPWLFRDDMFRLFAALMFGIMGFTFFLWFLTVRCLRAKARRAFADATKGAEMV